MKTTTLILIALALTTIGCKKFEDGPKLTFRTVKQRLVGDRWFATFTSAGAESIYMSRYDDLYFHSKDEVAITVTDLSNGFLYRSYKLDGDILQIDTANSFIYQDFGKITYLSNKKMIIENVWGSGETLIYERL